MVGPGKFLLLSLMIYAVQARRTHEFDRKPKFIGSISNVTVAFGRDAVFTCAVENLSGFRLGWIKSDSKAILSIHDHIITHNRRISVSQTDGITWNLIIRNVRPEDEGTYMCQINSNPQQNQTGTLKVVIPPDFFNDKTDVNVMEYSQAKLTCRAKGVPKPHITWRREDGKHIILREPVGNGWNYKSPVTMVEEFHGEELKLPRVSRMDMGVYLCIASNGIPPTVSKRYNLNVHFVPAIRVPNQLLGSPLHSKVTLECNAETSPMSINYWTNEKGTMIMTNSHHVVETIQQSLFEIHMVLTIKSLQKNDVGTYHCVVKNSLGDVDSTIRLYVIPPSTGKTELASRYPHHEIFYPNQPNRDKKGNDSTSKENHHSGSNHAHRPPTLQTTNSTINSIAKNSKNRPKSKDEPSHATDPPIKYNALLLLFLSSFLLVLQHRL